MAKFDVTVNGVLWDDITPDAGDRVSYEDVVDFAYRRVFKMNSTDRQALRVEYEDALGDGGKYVSDVLHEGMKIKVTDGTKFTVANPRKT